MFKGVHEALWPTIQLDVNNSWHWIFHLVVNISSWHTVLSIIWRLLELLSFMHIIYDPFTGLQFYCFHMGLQIALRVSCLLSNHFLPSPHLRFPFQDSPCIFITIDSVTPSLGDISLLPSPALHI